MITNGSHKTPSFSTLMYIIYQVQILFCQSYPSKFKWFCIRVY